MKRKIHSITRGVDGNNKNKHLNKFSLFPESRKRKIVTCVLCLLSVSLKKASCMEHYHHHACFSMMIFRLWIILFSCLHIHIKLGIAEMSAREWDVAEDI